MDAIARITSASIASTRGDHGRGPGAVFLGRFVALLRILVGAMAGVGAMPFARCSLCNAFGAAARSAAFGRRSR